MARRSPMPELPSGTVTFLFTDIEGSTRLWEQHPEAMEVALARHDELAARILPRHGGLLIKHRGEGDSLFAVFARAADAVAAATELQRALTAEPWPAPMSVGSRQSAVPTGGNAESSALALSRLPIADCRLPTDIGGLRVRIALHTGDAALREGDYFGAAVN